MQQPAQQTQQTPQQVFDEAYHLLRVGDVFEAAKRAGKLRMHFPEDAPILALHGFVLARMGVHPQALSDLIKAAQITEHALDNEEGENPARPRIADQMIRLCVQIGRSSMAIGELDAANEAIDKALKLDPDRGDAVAAKAELLAMEGEASAGLELIKQGQEDMLDSRPLVLSKARVLLEVDDTDTQALKEVIDELATESQVGGLGALDLGDLLRMMGMAYDRIGSHDKAFNAFRRAANLRRGSYDPRAHTMMTTKVIHDWTAQNIAKLKSPEQSGERFVLLLGAPHSGVEQLAEMLGQLDDVQVIGPLESLSSVCVKHLGALQGVLRPVPFEPTRLRGTQLKEANAAYSSQLGALMGESAKRGIDTHPLNIPLAGAASAFLPGLNIVLCRRDPMESVMACYCDAMVGNHPYAGELLNAAGFVADCNRMLDHWAKELVDDAVGANIIAVDYSDFSSDPKKTAARIAREIGLDARAPSIKRTPSFDRGPGAHPDAYASYTSTITGLFEPAGS